MTSLQQRRRLRRRSPPSGRRLSRMAVQATTGAPGRAEDASEGATRGDVPAISRKEAPASRRHPASPRTRQGSPRCVRSYPYRLRESANSPGWAARGCDVSPRRRRAQGVGFPVESIAPEFRVRESGQSPGLARSGRDTRDEDDHWAHAWEGRPQAKVSEPEDLSTLPAERRAAPKTAAREPAARKRSHRCHAVLCWAFPASAPTVS